MALCHAYAMPSDVDWTPEKRAQLPRMWTVQNTFFLAGFALGVASQALSPEWSREALDEWLRLGSVKDAIVDPKTARRALVEQVQTMITSRP